MILAVMIAADKDAVICDLAETYHIYDYRALPVTLLATLCCGLRENSRIRMKLEELHPVPVEFMVARAADDIAAIRYALTAKKGDETPEFYTDLILGKVKQKKASGFATVEDYERAKQEILSGG